MIGDSLVLTDTFEIPSSLLSPFEVGVTFVSEGINESTSKSPQQGTSNVGISTSQNADHCSDQTPIPSPINEHGRCHNEFCSQCSPNNDDFDTDVPTPSTASILSPFTPSTPSQRKKTFKTDKGKKRLVHRENWVVVRRKTLKNTGQRFVNKSGKVLEAKNIKDACSSKCRLKCRELISEEERRNIFEKFWALGDRSRQWDFVLKYTKKIPKRRQTTEVTKHNRQNTFVYYLPDKNKDIKKVCKTMFLNTIATSERLVTTAWKKFDGVKIEKDKRGCYEHKKNVMNDEMIRSVCDHVKCIPLVESHYCRQDSKKLYLEGIDSVSKMFGLYQDWFDGDKYTTKAQTKRQYREIVNANFNIAIYKPKKDTCDVCHAFNNKTNTTDEERKTYEEHLMNKKVARKLKKLDKEEAQKNSDVVAATFDFQKVLTTPHGEVSIFYYKRKLPTLNFTVYKLADKVGMCYMWHEGIAKRGSNEVSSCLYNFIREHASNGVKDFRFWSDNCGGQNRNRIVFAFYLVAAKHFNVNITHRFMEKGHTQNEGDSVHSTIERASQRKLIYVPEEWYCLVRWAKSEGNPYIVKEMTTDDIFDFKAVLSGKNWTKDVSNEKVRWNQVREVRVNHKQSDRIEYKYDLEEKERTIIVLRSGRRINAQRLQREFDIKKAYDGPLLIPFDKYKDLNDMCNSGIIPQKYHAFYSNLPHVQRSQANQIQVNETETQTDSE